MQRLSSPLGSSRGFSFVELAITMAILTTLFVALVMPLASQVNQRNVKDTERILEDAKDALIVFAMARGRLPCPASAASAGAESFAAGGSEANGNCSNWFDGYLPAATLGFTPNVGGFAMDAFGSYAYSRIRYSVSNQTIGGVTNPFTSTNGMRGATIANIGAITLLYVCDSGVGVVAGANCGTATKLTDTAPVVLWSSGPNAGTGGGASPSEAQNPSVNGGSADKIFVSATASNVSGSEFDDIVTWIPLGTLISRLVTVGQLP